MIKNCQHQQKGEPHTHTQEKSDNAATSMEDSITDMVHTTRAETSSVYN